MGKFRKFLCVVLLLVPMALTAYAQADIVVEVNGVRVQLEDQPPVIVEARTLVPIRGVFEMLGYEVGWDGYTNTATLTSAENTVLVTIGSPVAITNGAPVPLDVPAQIINNRTMLPLRAVLESVGNTLEWDGYNRVVRVTSGTAPPPPPVEQPYVPTPPEQLPYVPAPPEQPAYVPELPIVLTPPTPSPMPTFSPYIPPFSGMALIMGQPQVTEVTTGGHTFRIDVETNHHSESVWAAIDDSPMRFVQFPRTDTGSGNRTWTHYFTRNDENRNISIMVSSVGGAHVNVFNLSPEDMRTLQNIAFTTTVIR